MAKLEMSKKSLLESFQRNMFIKLNELRQENEFCDLILKSEDGFEFGVHKNVLSASSKYFKDLLTSEMKEKCNKCISLPDICGDTLEKIISFIYTNEFKQKIEDIEKIIKYAVLYQLEELIEICSLALRECINDHTCLSYWRIARYNLIYGLEDICLTYIVSKIEFLFKNSFLDDLIIEEMQILLSDDRSHSQCCEQQIFEHVWKWAFGKVSETRKLSEVFSEVVDSFRFSQLKVEFIISKIFGNEDLADDVNLLKKVAKLTKNKYKSEGKNKTHSHFIFPKKRLLGIGPNIIFRSLGEENTTQEEKEFRNDFGFTTFGNNFLLICGGEYSSSCEYLDPVTNEWKDFPSMLRKTSGNQCSYIGNKIYSCGGLGFKSESVTIFDLGREKWYDGPEMLSHNDLFGVTALAGSLYAVGRNIEILDPRTKNWSVVNNSKFSDEPYTRCVSSGPYIYCFTQEYRYIFDTRTNKFGEKVKFNGFDFTFDICELDGDIYGFGYASVGTCDSEEFTQKLIQNNLDGTNSYIKSFGTCYEQNPSKNALVALYY